MRRKTGSEVVNLFQVNAKGLARDTLAVDAQTCSEDEAFWFYHDGNQV